MSKPSIMLINRVYPPLRGATGRLAQDLAHALEQSGWKVTIITTGPKPGLDIQQNITIHRVKGESKCQGVLAYLKVWFKLAHKALRLPKHDVVVTLTDPPMVVVAGRLVSLFKGSKHVHWCHDLYPDLLQPLGVKIPGFLYGLFFWMSRRAMNTSSQVIVIGRCMARHLVSTGVQKQKISMIANWADFDVIAPKKEGLSLPDKEKQDIQASYKKPEELKRDSSAKFRILYAGNIGRAHSVKAIIEAADLLSKHKEIEFMFVGDQYVHDILARERGKRGLENIKFMPYQPLDNLRHLMESGDIHLVS
ncbi:MAG: glycosyltransferase family 4 protein, partial [Alphaproteobacteria bacterium]|nr:glycosyltransferase family 4 protein [Alphaproteobacteria bacterium]